MGFFLLLTALMTWPWVLHLKDHVSDPGDPFYSTWALAWEYHQTFHDPLHLFDGNIFYPFKNTLAYTESMYGTAVLVFPFFALGWKPVTVHNLALFLAYTLCGYGMFRLTRTATGSTVAAVISGIIFAFGSFRNAHLSHLMYTASVWVPLTLEALILFLRQWTWKRAVWLGVAFFFNGLSCVHWFVLMLIPLPFAFFLLVWAHGLLRERAVWLRAAVALTVAMLALVPFLLPYRAVSRELGYLRPLNEGSARPRDWLVAHPLMRLYENRMNGNDNPECALFPGISVLLLIGAAIFLAPKRTKTASDTRPLLPRPSPRLLHLLDGAAVLAFVLAVYSAAFADGLMIRVLGRPLLYFADSSRPLMLFLLLVLVRWWLRLPTVLGGHAGKGLGDYLRESARPEVWVAWSWVAFGFFGSLGEYFAFHRVLYRFIFLFQSIRPPRWANIACVGLALLAGLGAAVIAGRIARPGLRRALVIFLALAVWFELRIGPFDGFFKAELDPPPVYLAIKELPMQGGLVELPVGFMPNFYYTLRAADHLRPVVTATSSFGSPVQWEIEALTQQRPIPDQFLNLLDSIPTSYIIVHEEFLNWEDLDERQTLHDLLWRGMKAGRLRFLKRYEGGTGGNYWDGMTHQDDLYAVVKNEPEAKTVEMPSWLSPEGVPMHSDEEAVNWLPAAIESPAPNAELSGETLTISGWCQDWEGAPCSEIHILIDGEERPPAEFTRYARAESIDPQTGETRETGYKATYLPYWEAGEHRLEAYVYINKKTGEKRRRRLGPYTFYWKPRQGL